MPRFRRLIRGTLLLALSFAIGAVVFEVIRNRPRCTIQGPHRLMHVSEDGQRIITHPATFEGAELGPIQVWDTWTGQPLASYLPAATYLRWGMSRDGRWLAASPNSTGLVYLIDWQRGTCLPVLIEGGLNVFRMEFSATARWCVVHSNWITAESSALIDVANGQFVRKFPHEIRITADERRFIHLDEKKQRIEIWNLPRLQKVSDIATKFNEIALAPNGRWLASWNMSCDPRISDYNAILRDDGLTVWDLTTGRMQCRLEALRGRRQVVFGRNARQVVTWSGHTNKLSLVEVESGRITKIDTAGYAVARFTDSEERLCQWDLGMKRFRMREVATGSTIWEMPDAVVPGYAGGASFLLAPHLGIHINENSTSLAIIDLNTGREVRTLALDMQPSTKPNLSQNGKAMVLAMNTWRHQHPVRSWLGHWWTEPQAVVVALEDRQEECRVLFRLHRQERNEFSLSADGKTLIGEQTQIQEVETTRDAPGKQQRVVTIRVWDVQPHRAWKWATLGGLGVALASLLVEWAWRRRKKLPLDCTAPGGPTE